MPSNQLDFLILARDKASDKFKAVGKASSDAGDKLEKFKRGAKLAAVGLAAVGAAAGVVGFKLLDHASKLELMDKKAKTVFGDQISLVQKWAKQHAFSMGLTSRETIGLAANFADLLIPMKFSREEATRMSTKVIGLAGALAEWSGGQRTAAEVAQSLSKAMLGEREELKGLGISISEADVKARLAAKGQDDLTGSMREQAEAVATMELIFEKSGDAQAAFAGGSKGLARRVGEARAQFREWWDEITVKLTPAIIKMADWIEARGIPAVEAFARSIKENWTDIFKPITENLVRFIAILDNTIGNIARLPFIGKDSPIGKVGSALADARREVEAWDKSVANMQKVVKLEGDISDLDAKIAKARAELDSPKTTKTRRVALEAEIKQLLAQKAKAQANVNSLKGKSVDLTAVNKTGAAVSAAQRMLNSLPRSVTVRINAITGGNIATLPDLPLRAHGGPVRAGRPYIVGEEGPEILVPKQSGTVISNKDATGKGSAMGMGGMDPKAYAQALVRELRASGLTLVAVDSGKRADLLRRAG